MLFLLNDSSTEKIIAGFRLESIYEFFSDKKKGGPRKKSAGNH